MPPQYMIPRAYLLSLPHDWEPIWCESPCQEHVVGWFCLLCLKHVHGRLDQVPFSFCWGDGADVRPRVLGVD